MILIEYICSTLVSERNCESQEKREVFFEANSNVEDVGREWLDAMSERTELRKQKTRSVFESERQHLRCWKRASLTQCGEHGKNGYITFFSKKKVLYNQFLKSRKKGGFLSWA